MISMRRRLLLMLALILLVTQLISAFWLWHESQEQISFLVDETLSAKVRTERVDTEIAEAIASLLAPSLIMMIVTLLASFWAISWIIRPLNQLQERLEKRSADNLTPLPLNSDSLEMMAVTTTLNQLFSRLDNTIQQERLFTADAAHELRTPLAGIRLHLELMEKQGIPQSGPLIARIDQLMHTVEQLLMLARAGQDMLPEFGDDAYVKTDNFMNGRTNGVATYRNNDFFGLVDGLKFAIQYQGKNENDGRAGSKANGDGWGLSSSYEIIDGLSVGAAYASSNRTAGQKAGTYGKGDKADIWAGGLKYDNNAVYLAATYSQSRNIAPISGTATINNTSTSVSGFANKAEGLELVAQYQFDFGLRPSLGYVQQKGKDIEGIGDADLVKYIDIGTYYYFNKNMSTYVDYKINQLDSNNKLGLKDDNVIAVALTYQF